MPEPRERGARAMPPQVGKLIGPAFAHKKTAQGFLSPWKLMREELYAQGTLPLRQLPSFCEHLIKLLFETREGAVMAAVKMGDVPFFIAWLFRIDLVDVAMIKRGANIAERMPLIRARATVDAYRIIAEKKLGKGNWPPRSPNDTVLR